MLLGAIVISACWKEFSSLSLSLLFDCRDLKRATCVRHSCDLLFGRSFLMASCWLAWCLCFRSSDRSFRDFVTESRLWPALSLFFPSEVKWPVSPCFRSLGLEFSCFSFRDFLALFILILFQVSFRVGTQRVSLCDLPCYVHLDCSEAILCFGTRCLMYLLLYLLRDLKSLQVRCFSLFSFLFPNPRVVYWVDVAAERTLQLNYWKEHSIVPSVEAMMLDSQASKLDQEERPEVHARSVCCWYGLDPCPGDLIDSARHGTYVLEV
jgi:hypothetical protein